jgi:hypothetical protein
VEPGGRNIIPLRVHNARYRIEPGEVKMLRDSRTGIVHLSDLDLPVVYYDSQIVTIDEAGKRNEVTIVSLN